MNGGRVARARQFVSERSESNKLNPTMRPKGALQYDCRQEVGRVARARMAKRADGQSGRTRTGDGRQHSF